MDQTRTRVRTQGQPLTRQSSTRRWDRIETAHRKYERISSKSRVLTPKQREAQNDIEHRQFRKKLKSIMQPNELTDRAGYLMDSMVQARHEKAALIHENWARTAYQPQQRRITNAVDSKLAYSLRQEYREARHRHQQKSHTASWEHPRKPSIRILHKPEGAGKAGVGTQIGRLHNVGIAADAANLQRLHPRQWNPVSLAGSMSLHHAYSGIGTRSIEGAVSNRECMGSHFAVLRGRAVTDQEWGRSGRRTVSTAPKSQLDLSYPREASRNTDTRTSQVDAEGPQLSAPSWRGHPLTDAALGPGLGLPTGSGEPG